MQHAALCFILTLMLAAQAVELRQPLDTPLFEAKAAETDEWLRASRFSLFATLLSATALGGYAVCWHYAVLSFSTLRLLFCACFFINAGLILVGRHLVTTARSSGWRIPKRRVAFLD